MLQSGGTCQPMVGSISCLPTSGRERSAHVDADASPQQLLQRPDGHDHAALALGNDLRCTARQLRLVQLQVGGNGCLLGQLEGAGLVGGFLH